MLQASEAAITVAARIGNVAFKMEAMARKVVALARLEQWDAARQPVKEILVKMPEVTDDVVQEYMLSALALYYADLGDVSRALLFQHRYAEAARRAGDRKGESCSLWNIGLYSAQLGRYANARVSYEVGLPIAEAIGDRHWQTSHKIGLSYALWCGGDHDGALEAGEAALRELRTSGYRRIGLADCLAYLGLILEDARNYSTAAAYLAESRALYLDGGQHGSGAEVQAIEARCRLALGQREEAQQLASEVWSFARAYGTAMMDYPSRVYLCIADVVAQVAMPGVTEREVLDAGYAELARKAEMISDPEWRRSFLEDERSNRALAARWTSLNLAAPDCDETGATADK
jgi:tetratricopeptide (TPR) repeat protein